MRLMVRFDKWWSRRKFARLRGRRIGHDHGQLDSPAWIAVAMHDTSERRGLWYRETVSDMGDHVVQLCAGREGDDAFCEIAISDGSPGAESILDVMNTARLAIDINSLDPE